MAGAAAGVSGKDVDKLSRRPKAVLMRWLLMAWNGATLHDVFSKMDSDKCAFPMPSSHRFFGVPPSWVPRKRRGSWWAEVAEAECGALSCERCML